MSIWGMGVMMGPIMGPSLGAWLTETYSWHWVFFVNLPFGAITVLGLIVFMDETRKDLSLRFDWFGFAALAVGDRLAAARARPRRGLQHRRDVRQHQLDRDLVEGPGQAQHEHQRDGAGTEGASGGRLA